MAALVQKPVHRGRIDAGGGDPAAFHQFTGSGTATDFTARRAFRACGGAIPDPVSPATIRSVLSRGRVRLRPAVRWLSGRVDGVDLGAALDALLEATLSLSAAAIAERLDGVARPSA